MSNKISLQKIIESVLDDKKVAYEETNDSNVRSLRRGFDNLIKKLGGEKKQLKNSKGNFEFYESEVPFMKVIIAQLYDNCGLIAQFANEHNKNTDFSSKDVHMLIQSLLDEADKGGASEDELYQMADFFGSIFLYSPLRSLEYCHRLIDMLSMNLQDLPSDRQSIYIGKLEHILKKEFALRVAESTMEIIELAEIFEMSKEIVDDDKGAQLYYEQDPEIRFEYIQRDKRVLEKIQEDDDLRYYIEKKVGRKAEEIFNYASLEGKSE